MMADDQALQEPSTHLANGSRGRSQVLPYQPHGFTGSMSLTQETGGIYTVSRVLFRLGNFNLCLQLSFPESVFAAAALHRRSMQVDL